MSGGQAEPVSVFWFLPELGVLCVHHGRTLCEDLCDADGADLLLNSSRHFLNLWNNDFLQHHPKHPAVQTG